jgi:hypothetical protein
MKTELGFSITDGDGTGAMKQAVHKTTPGQPSAAAHLMKKMKERKAEKRNTTDEAGLDKSR